MSGYILITRPESEAKKDAETLHALGYQTWVEPLIEIKATDQDTTDIAPYDALIFTSANAVRLFKPNHKNTPIYTVGDNTKQAAIKAGYEKIQSADGNAKDLLKLILKTAEKDTRLLFPRGEHIAHPIAEELLEAGHTIDEKIIYQSNHKEEFSPALIKHIQAGNITATCLYSKRTAESFTNLINKHGLSKNLSTTKLLSISPAVLKYVHSQINEKDWQNTYSAKHANGEGMLNLIKQHVMQQK